jgi:DNA-binding response OmpR family regulator
MRDVVRKILLVDDEERDLHAICELLESSGYEVCKASSSTEAVEAMRNSSYVPDLLVCDIALPDVNGVEVYRSLSQIVGVWLNVLFISAHSGAEVLKFYGLPMSDVHFMAKPLDNDEFSKRVHSLITKPITFRLAS